MHQKVKIEETFHSAVDIFSWLSDVVKQVIKGFDLKNVTKKTERTTTYKILVHSYYLATLEISPFLNKILFKH